MNAVDGSEQFESKSSQEQSPALLTVILDTNPAAWALLADTLPLSSAVANVLVFVNAHLACNYTNKVAIIASHCDKAQWLYPTATPQKAPGSSREKRKSGHQASASTDQLSEPTKRLKLNAPRPDGSSSTFISKSESNKYRPFRLVEEEVVRNLTSLLTTTSAAAVSATTSTMIAGALTLALSYINRESIAYQESVSGVSTNAGDSSAAQAAPTDSNNPVTNALQSRILLLTLSPSTDLAHQYIPIMNSIFACQRLAIPIDILQLPLPQTSSTHDSTVFLQQAADATHGIFIPAQLTASTNATTSTDSKTRRSTAQAALLTYLLTTFLPSPSTRSHLILPTRIDVDFRAACFCHRNIVDIGFVCSICLSIFCSVPDNGDCLTCGTHLTLGAYGGKPVVVPGRARRRRRAPGRDGSAVGTPA